jgi:small subunit ribosomal protein S20
VANTRSAEKQYRQSVRRRARNMHVKTNLRTQVRKVREAFTAGDGEKTKAELKNAIRTISKAASKGVIHKGQASRRIARLQKAAARSATPKA